MIFKAKIHFCSIFIYLFMIIIFQFDIAIWQVGGPRMWQNEDELRCLDCDSSRVQTGANVMFIMKISKTK